MKAPLFFAFVVALSLSLRLSAVEVTKVSASNAQVGNGAANAIESGAGEADAASFRGCRAFL